MGLSEFLKNFKIDSYYTYLLYISGFVLIFSLFVPLRIDANVVIKSSILVMVSSLFIWLFDEVIEKINIYQYEVYSHKSVDTLPSQDLMSLYRKKAFHLILFSTGFQFIFWVIVVYVLVAKFWVNP